MLVRLSPSLSLRTRFRLHLPRPGERVVVLRASGVFPPGHPTTRLCLQLLAELAGERPPPALADVGSGSGVLALAAAALGVPRVVAVDPSPRAVYTTQVNARENGLEAPVTVIRGTAACLRGPFPAVVANLPYGVLWAEGELLSAVADTPGHLLLSGFRDIQEEALARRFAPHGWQLKRRLTADDWPHTLPPEGSFTWVAWHLSREGE